MKTTRTAQYLSPESAFTFQTHEKRGGYAAAAARSSCLLALVKSLRTAENIRVEKSSTIIIVPEIALESALILKTKRM